jgi:preprotein translocase subunit SecA
MNRCINALRKLQTERGIRSQAFPETDVPPGLGLMDLRQVARTKPMDTDADAEPEPTPAAAPTAAATPTGFDALMALADKQLAQRYRDYGMAAFTGAPTAPATAPPAPPTPGSMGSNCKPAAAPAKPTAQPRNTPRNAPCPCNSGQKFKRCCGKETPIVQNRAA